MLSLQIYADSARTQLLADWTQKVQPPRGGGFTFGSGEFGFSSLSAPFIPMSEGAAFEVFSWPGRPDVVVTDRAGVEVWNGRLEDKRVVPGGAAITAFGYFNAFYDVPYTALWSVTGSGGWRPVPQSDFAVSDPSKFEMDNNNRLYIAVKKNHSSALDNRGVMVYKLPDLGERDAATISIDYDIIAADSLTYALIISARTREWSGAGTNSVTTTTSDTGTLTLSAGANAQYITVQWRQNSATPHEYTGETGDAARAICTNIRITSSGTTITGGEIARSIHDWLMAINPTQISDLRGLMASTGPDLPDEIYTDEWPGDILKNLAERHNYEVGIFEARRLHFWPRGAHNTRIVYIDAVEYELEESLGPLRNEAYAVYRDGNNRLLRTTTSSKPLLIDQAGITLRGVVGIDTTSQTTAEARRGNFLDNSDFGLRASVRFDRAYDDTGAPVPLYMIRAGVTVILRNLSPALSSDIDNVRTFRLRRTNYDPFANGGRGAIEVEPVVPIPSVVSLLAAASTEGRETGGGTPRDMPTGGQRQTGGGTPR